MRKLTLVIQDKPQKNSDGLLGRESLAIKVKIKEDFIDSLELFCSLMNDYEIEVINGAENKNLKISVVHFDIKRKSSRPGGSRFVFSNGFWSLKNKEVIFGIRSERYFVNYYSVPIDVFELRQLLEEEVGQAFHFPNNEN